MTTVKIKKILFWSFGIIVLLFVGAYFAMDYATKYVLRSIASQESQTPKAIDKSQEREHMDKAQPSLVTEQSPPLETKIDPSKENNSETSATTENSNKPAPPQSSTSGQTPPSQEPASKPTEANQPPKAEATNSAPPKYEANITPEKAKQAQEEITLKEKALVSSVLLKKLSPSEISLFVKMSGDGLTVEEKKEAKKIILQKLTEEEYNELIAIAAKLGLSQGKTYQESQKEFQGKAKP